MIVPCTSVEQPGWLQLRQALWSEGSTEEHRAEMASLLVAPHRYAQFLAHTEDSQIVGFVEAAIRTDYVNGTSTSPVAFLEGIYVAPEFRRRGIGTALVLAVSAWARSAGCRELASDASLENKSSHAMHRALGFQETERVVYFLKELGSQ
ncbi:aminoglycoside 6'-N-acetyltransferase [Citrobacter freundii]